MLVTRRHLTRFGAILLFLCNKLFVVENCESARTCTECIQMGEDCLWCLDRTLISKRCLRRNNTNLCHSFVELREEIKIEDPGNPSGAGASPSVISIKLIPKRKLDLTFRFKPDKDAALDVYQLQDLSQTMTDDLENMKKQFSSFLEVLRKHKNAHLGFGAFYDKPILPSLPYNKVKKQYQTNIHSFLNFANISSNLESINRYLSSDNIKGNADSAESQLEALLQVAACLNLGWRVDSRKIIILSTDDSPKTAGSGRIHGIMEPDDGKCHVNNNINTYEIVQDYPSLHQIKATLLENGQSPIFLVTSNVYSYYQDVVEILKETNAEVALISNDSTDFIRVFEQSLKNVKNRIFVGEIEHPHLEVEYKVYCKGIESSLADIKTRMCQNVLVDDTIIVNVSVTLDTCDVSQFKEYSIYILSIGKVSILYKSSCNCDCEMPVEIPKPSERCNNHGKFICESCYCDDGFSGETCQCNNLYENISQCIDTKDSSSAICSNKGKCECGACVCDDTIDGKSFGRYCECSMLKCGTYNGQICGGPERGSCSCNTCECLPQFRGIDCGMKNCSHIIHTEDCRTQKKLVCNDHGKCNCGVCECETGYFGEKCEFVKTDPENCTINSACVECFVKNAEKVDLKCQECSNKNISTSNSDGTYDCSIITKDGCTHRYAAINNSTIYLKRLDRENDCIYFQRAGLIAGSVVAGLVILALISTFTYFYLSYLKHRSIYRVFEEKLKCEQTELHLNPLNDDHEYR